MWMFWGLGVRGEVPENLVADGIPELPVGLRERAGPYLEFRTASLQGWHPVRREMVVLTRFAESAQLHRVEFPGGARRQLTFLSEPVSEAQYRPGTGDSILFRQDRGGGEFFQLYRYDVADGRVTMLTDGKSQNTGARWSESGGRVAWSSTRRNGRDTDIWVMDPDRPAGARMVLECRGGGWGVSDWSADEKTLLVGEYVSINEAGLHLLDVATGKLRPLTGKSTHRVSYAEARFSRDGRSVFCTTDRDGEFHRLVRIDIATGQMTSMLTEVPWDVDFVEVSPDGKWVAAVTNEDGASVLRLVDAKSGKVKRLIALPRGVIGGLEWHGNGRDLGFNLAHARSPADAYSVDVRNGRVTRWTEREDVPDVGQRIAAGGFGAGHRVVPGLGGAGSGVGRRPDGGVGRQLWGIHEPGLPDALSGAVQMRDRHRGHLEFRDVSGADTGVSAGSEAGGVRG